MDEQKIIEIETKLAYQEDHIQELNKVIISMQKQVDDLELTCKALKDKVSTMQEYLPADNNIDETPPHY